MKKILHIPNYYPPHHGGIEDVCYNIVRNTVDAEQKVICFSDNKKAANDNIEGIEVTRCGCFAKIHSQSLSFSYIINLARILKDFNPDIVHFHAPNPLISIYLLILLPKHTRLIVHWHSDIVEQKIIYSFYKGIEKKLLCRANKIIITAPCYLDKSKPLQSHRDKCQVIANVVSEDKLTLKEEDYRQIQELKQGNPILFFIGRHVPYKGIEYLIKAETLIKSKCQILIAGDGPLTAQLIASTKSSRIKFIGKINDDELRQYFYASYAFVFPSITKNEAFGIALAEALYCGLPSVNFTIDGSGVNWVSPNGISGIEVENSNAEKFAEAIDCILSDKLLHDRLSLGAVQYSHKNFTLDSLRVAINNLYKSM